MELSENNSSGQITYEEFAKIEIRAGLIEICEKVEESTKMLKLQVDFGEMGKRQILTGLGATVTPDELVQKLVLFVFNMKPRKIMGFDSEGMIMGTDEEQPKVILAPEGVGPGTKVN